MQLGRKALTDKIQYYDQKYCNRNCDHPPRHVCTFSSPMHLTRYEHPAHKAQYAEKHSLFYHIHLHYNS